MYPNLDKETNKDINDVSFENEDEKSVELRPETQGNVATDVPPTMGHKIGHTSCCSFIKDGVKKFWLLDWYIAPITYDIGFSFSCLLYHWVNFGFALGMWILLVTGISTFAPLIILACVGLPLLYFLAEVTILLTRLNHGYNYYLVEKDDKLLTSEKWRVKLTLDNKNLPLCETCCLSGSRLNRIKFVVTSCDFYLMIIYHLIINPIGSLLLGICSLPLLYILYYMSAIIQYPITPKYFKNNRECVFGDNDCGNLPCKCSGWAINSFGDVFALFVISLVLLPFTCHLCNYAAKLGKSLNYYILTDFYKYNNNNNNSNPNQTLISSNQNSMVVNTSTLNQKIEINNNDQIITNDHELQSVPRSNKDINDVGVNDVDL